MARATNPEEDTGLGYKSRGRRYASCYARDYGAEAVVAATVDVIAGAEDRILAR